MATMEQLKEAMAAFDKALLHLYMSCERDGVQWATPGIWGAFDAAREAEQNVFALLGGDEVREETEGPLYVIDVASDEQPDLARRLTNSIDQAEAAGLDGYTLCLRCGNLIEDGDQCPTCDKVVDADGHA